MNVDSITNGIVIDHIKPGKSMEIYKFLKLDALDCSVALIRNAPSKKSGRKDIIKIDAPIALDLDALGYLDAGITINIIKEGMIREKYHPGLPLELTNVIRCKNPRCITTTEQELPHVFKLVDKERTLYRCLYCETNA